MPASQQTLVDAYFRLQEHKKTLKDARAELRAECEATSGWKDKADEIATIRAELNGIKNQVAEHTGIGQRIDDAKAEVEAARAEVDDIMVSLLAAGSIAPGSEIRAGDQGVLLIPKVRVTFKAEQLAMPL